ncbi:MAG: PTS galactitol transporter subunit IIC [Anaerostipes sp.]|jgi:PTS system galactitol-specific IIC component|nr:PTS galactitol transporter subunit IIC [Anaerostipes sp.]MDD3745780.1 PTS galactitol transporter subunit IIC [Anaerostipes sp.]MDD4370016.1 PTS galactitol transporter subunit IIC [Anaerostipes sp.]
MSTLLSITQTILNMGATALLPFIILILGLIFGMKFGHALKSGLFVGIGFSGLSLVVGLLTTTIQPISDYYSKMGKGFTTLDLGFAASGAASWTVPFAPIAVPLIVAANFILIFLFKRKVLNVDIWNYIHFLIPGALAYGLFGNIILGVVVTVVCSIVSLLVAELVAPKWQEYFGLDGTTCSTFSFITFMYPLSWLVNKIIDKIPGLKDLDLDMDWLESKLGVFGESCFVGLIVGVFLGIITKQPIEVILQTGMGISAVLILIPRMVSIMMEGITPIGNAANAFMRKRLGEDAELWIGMDVALGLGDPACVTCTAICIPITIAFAFLIPNMTYFPIGVLTIVCYTTVFCVMASNGNLIRSLICSILSMFIIVFCANLFVPEATSFFNVTGLDLGGKMATDGFFGFNVADILLCIVHRFI